MAGDFTLEFGVNCDQSAVMVFESVFVFADFVSVEYDPYTRAFGPIRVLSPVGCIFFFIIEVKKCSAQGANSFRRSSKFSG
ncbi:MAG TPA: hypothetical protein VN457_04570, partial [Chlamydiales bacterium]|nr:hypothetical protein [Chlamydiales bacterium]